MAQTAVDIWGEFLAQSAPRDLPPAIRRATLRGLLSLPVIMLLGTGFILPGILALFFIFPVHIADELSLDLKAPSVTQGTVLQTERTHVKVNHSPTYSVRFRFFAPELPTKPSAESKDARQIEGQCYVRGREYAAGESIEIEYNPERPTVARIRGGSLDIMGYAGAAFVTFPLIGLIVPFFLWRRRAQKIGLLRDGRFATGRVIAVEKTLVHVNNQPRYRIRVQFAAEEGEREGVDYAYGADVDAASLWQENGEPKGILYYPGRPDVMLVDLLLNRRG